MTSRALLTGITTLTRATASQSPRIANTTASQSRALSSNGTIAFERLKDALEEYRATNYSREIPSRFKKEIIRAAKQDESEAEHIFLEGFQKMIVNIKMEHKVSPSDIQTIFYEIGDSSGKVPAERMMSML